MKPNSPQKLPTTALTAKDGVGMLDFTTKIQQQLEMQQPQMQEAYMGQLSVQEQSKRLSLQIAGINNNSLINPTDSTNNLTNQLDKLDSNMLRPSIHFGKAYLDKVN